MSLQEVDKSERMQALVTEYHRRRFDRSMTLARKADRLAKLSRVLIVIGGTQRVSVSGRWGTSSSVSEREGKR